MSRRQRYIKLAEMYGWDPYTVRRLTPYQQAMYLQGGDGSDTVTFKTMAEYKEFRSKL